MGPDDETYTFNTAGIVGGGSVLYTAITNTPYKADYQVWSDETGLDLSYQNLKYAAEETERAFNIHTKPDGLLRVGDRLFRDSARALGIEVHPAKIAKQNCLWCGYCDGVNMCKYDARGGSFTGYLPTALEHGVEIIPDAKAEKVLIEKQGTGFRGTGVAYIRNGEREVVNAPRVVVSCGQYGSTPLLLRSGYGPRRLVEQLIVENPNVGDHTDARPWCERMTAVFDQPISRWPVPGWKRGGCLLRLSRHPPGQAIRPDPDHHGPQGAARAGAGSHSRRCPRVRLVSQGVHAESGGQE